jgi:hypothetical protein
VLRVLVAVERTSERSRHGAEMNLTFHGERRWMEMGCRDWSERNAQLSPAVAWPRCRGKRKFRANLS